MRTPNQTTLKALDNTIDANIASAYAPSQANIKIDYDDLISSICEETFRSKLRMSIGAVKSLNFGNETDILFCESSMNNIFYHKFGSLQASRPTTISAERLSKIWRIEPEVASKAIAQNSHFYRQGIGTELSKRFSTNDRMLRYKRIRSNFFTDTFFVTSKGISSRGNNCAQLFVSDMEFVAIYPMKSKREFSFTLV